MHFYGLDSSMHEKNWYVFNAKYHFLTSSFSPHVIHSKETNYGLTEIKFLCTGLLKQQNKLCHRRWKTSEAFERNFFSYYPLISYYHSFPHSFNKVEKLYFRKILVKMNLFIDLFPGFKRIY